MVAHIGRVGCLLEVCVSVDLVVVYEVFGVALLLHACIALFLFSFVALLLSTCAMLFGWIDFVCLCFVSYMRFSWWLCLLCFAKQRFIKQSLRTPSRPQKVYVLFQSCKSYKTT